MKLKKTKKFNTVESYAACICIATTCTCSCDSTSVYSSNGSRVFNNKHYDSNNSAVRG
ncbi:hypothetical protein KQI38_10215 [Tissierella carlieri]|uniref:Bacteriocin n=1 Tax=Tissierella carlieri TaxID=689904 RepID=A0ABT1S8L7_9FIRM|nr:hypothetical protein [Tissierella carlieri]MBU5312405.1 hypothetical protein [Tissierella carlieri]MCQ4922813.1 hypothetical protein [Tissierella carlieri]MDU5081022.1 hypothetical protein [Bacillota bacterium]